MRHTIGCSSKDADGRASHNLQASEKTETRTNLAQRLIKLGYVGMCFFLTMTPLWLQVVGMCIIPALYKMLNMCIGVFIIQYII